VTGQFPLRTKAAFADLGFLANNKRSNIAGQDIYANLETLDATLTPTPRFLSAETGAGSDPTAAPSERYLA
jgi:hypothetical protein